MAAEFPHGEKERDNIAIDAAKKMMRIGDRFEVIGNLGSGASGEVYEAYDNVTKSTVAVKMDCFPGPLDLLDEADMLNKLDGVKGVPKLLATGVHDAKNFIAMELLGKDMFDISEYVLTEKDGLLFAYKSINILQGIGYMKEESCIEI